MTRALLIALIAMLAAFVFIGRPQAGRQPVDSLQTFAQAFSFIRNNYAREIDEATLMRAAIRGMMDELDRHSVFLPPDVFRDASQEYGNDYLGLGISFRRHEGRLLVEAVQPGSPAGQAGVTAGDRVTEIDGVSVIGLSLEQCRDRMRGPAGTRVRLALERPGVAGRELSMVRSEVAVPPVTGWELAPGIGIIKVRTFEDGAAAGFLASYRELTRVRGVEAVVIDLRGNPGGIIDEAVAIADLFIDQGVVVRIEGRAGKHSQVERATPSVSADSIRLAVLVDEETASAAEVLAGTLKDHGRAAVVGQPTFGKGSVQNLMELPDGSAIKLTVARYFTPSNAVIDGNGIPPHVRVDNGRAAVVEPFGKLTPRNATSEQLLARDRSLTAFDDVTVAGANAVRLMR